MNVLLPKVRKLARGQVTRPDIVLNLPFSLLRFPDHYIFADIEYPPVAIAKTIFPHFMCGIGQTIDFQWCPLHPMDAHVKTALPEGLDRGTPADRRTVSGQKLSIFAVKRRQLSDLALRKTCHPLALGSVKSSLRSWKRCWACHTFKPSLARVWHSPSLRLSKRDQP